MEYVTKSELKDLANKVPLTEQATLRKSAETRSPKSATFLSHSSADQEYIVGAIRLLNNHGAQVYIDKKDQSLPPYTNSKTAQTLKERIKKSDRFVLLASENSKNSRWVPWELGLADGFKGTRKIAIMPALDDAKKTSWTEWEYLGIYEKVVWGKLRNQPKPRWLVWNKEKNTARTLAKWLGG